ncbi:MAG: hypothetical protein ACI9OJ_001962 [Myxococcota bacterium]|jgi:hypothetical protein
MTTTPMTAVASRVPSISRLREPTRAGRVFPVTLRRLIERATAFVLVTVMFLHPSVLEAVFCGCDTCELAPVAAAEPASDCCCPDAGPVIDPSADRVSQTDCCLWQKRSHHPTAANAAAGDDLAQRVALYAALPAVHLPQRAASALSRPAHGPDPPPVPGTQIRLRICSWLC